jgi:hypothetical protein
VDQVEVDPSELLEIGILDIRERCETLARLERAIVL